MIRKAVNAWEERSQVFSPLVAIPPECIHAKGLVVSCLGYLAVQYGGVLVGPNMWSYAVAF